VSRTEELVIIEESTRNKGEVPKSEIIPEDQIDQEKIVK
jgi:hypothetical protein